MSQRESEESGGTCVAHSLTRSLCGLPQGPSAAGRASGLPSSAISAHLAPGTGLEEPNAVPTPDRSEGTWEGQGQGSKITS